MNERAVPQRQGGIWWLASYPKSGNTWVRTLLANYLADGVAPVDINVLSGLMPYGAERSWFDNLLGIETSDWPPRELEHWRPLVYEELARRAESPLYFKIHDAFVRNREGRRVFPAEATAGVVYIVRNPLDVAVSFAHHTAEPLERILAWMASPDHALCRPGRLHMFVRQPLSCWSGHVTSWLDEPDLRLLLMRYEDLKKSPVDLVARLVDFLGLPAESSRVQKAVEQSSFESLRRQEAEHGFREMQLPDRPFFRKGVVGSWREALTDRQVRAVIVRHGAVMRRLGYLGERDELLC